MNQPNLHLISPNLRIIPKKHLLDFWATLVEYIPFDLRMSSEIPSNKVQFARGSRETALYVGVHRQVFSLLQNLCHCFLCFGACRQFAEACGHALDVNERLIKEDQFEYQGEMKSHYKDMLSELSVVMNEQVRTSILGAGWAHEGG